MNIIHKTMTALLLTTILGSVALAREASPTFVSRDAIHHAAWPLYDAIIDHACTVPKKQRAAATQHAARALTLLARISNTLESNDHWKENEAYEQAHHLYTLDWITSDAKDTFLKDIHERLTSLKGLLEPAKKESWLSEQLYTFVAEVLTLFVEPSNYGGPGRSLLGLLPPLLRSRGTKYLVLAGALYALYKKFLEKSGSIANDANDLALSDALAHADQVLGTHPLIQTMRRIDDLREVHTTLEPHYYSPVDGTEISLAEGRANPTAIKGLHAPQQLVGLCTSEMRQAARDKARALRLSGAHSLRQEDERLKYIAQFAEGRAPKNLIAGMKLYRHQAERFRQFAREIAEEQNGKIGELRPENGTMALARLTAETFPDGTQGCVGGSPEEELEAGVRVLIHELEYYYGEIRHHTKNEKEAFEEEVNDDLAHIKLHEEDPPAWRLNHSSWRWRATLLWQYAQLRYQGTPHQEACRTLTTRFKAAAAKAVTKRMETFKARLADKKFHNLIFNIGDVNSIHSQSTFTDDEFPILSRAIISTNAPTYSVWEPGQKKSQETKAYSAPLLPKYQAVLAFLDHAEQQKALGKHLVPADHRAWATLNGGPFYCLSEDVSKRWLPELVTPVFIRRDPGCPERIEYPWWHMLRAPTVDLPEEAVDELDAIMSNPRLRCKYEQVIDENSTCQVDTLLFNTSNPPSCIDPPYFRGILPWWAAKQAAERGAKQAQTLGIDPKEASELCMVEMALRMMTNHLIQRPEYPNTPDGYAHARPNDDSKTYKILSEVPEKVQDTDEEGNPLYDENGHPVLVDQRDADGNLVYRRDSTREFIRGVTEGEDFRRHEPRFVKELEQINRRIRFVNNQSARYKKSLARIEGIMHEKGLQTYPEWAAEYDAARADELATAPSNARPQRFEPYVTSGAFDQASFNGQGGAGSYEGTRHWQRNPQLHHRHAPVRYGQSILNPTVYK